MKARKNTFWNVETDPLPTPPYPIPPQKRGKNSQNRDRRQLISEHIWTLALQNLYNAFFGALSVTVRENQAGPKDRGWSFILIFSQYKSYSKRLTTMIFAEVGVRYSSRFHHIMILASRVI